MMGLGSKLLSSLFGGNMDNLANALSGYSGVKGSTGSSCSTSLRRWCWPCSASGRAPTA